MNDKAEMLKMIQKGSKKAAQAYFEEYKIDPKDTRKEDYLVDLKGIEKEELIILHQYTNWKAPSYFLRMDNHTDLSRVDEEILMVFMQLGTVKSKKEIDKRFKQNLEAANDEVLVVFSQEGDEEALEILVDRYIPKVKKVIKKLDRKYFFRGLDIHDLIQEGVMGLFKSKEDFKIERKTKFKDFSKHVIEKHIGTLLYRSANLKNKVLNESFSYHSPIGSDSELTFEQMLKTDQFHPENTYVNKETFYTIWDKLTDLEQQVLCLYAEGLSYEEIGELVGKKKKAIDNTIQRIRKKGKQYMELFL